MSEASSSLAEPGAIQALFCILGCLEDEGLAGTASRRREGTSNPFCSGHGGGRRQAMLGCTVYSDTTRLEPIGILIAHAVAN